MKVKLIVMNHEAAISEFLRTRREKLTPEDVGLPTTPRRKVKGLRRGEVADLAGVSVEYYSKLERGKLRGVSEEILNSVCRALNLNIAETEHLLNLAKFQNSGSVKRRSQMQGSQWIPHQSLQWILDNMTNSPIILGNFRNDFVGGNLLGKALYSPLLEFDSRSPNFARFAFLSESAHDFFPNWQAAADDMVANLRIETSRHPYDKSLHELIGELSTNSAEFRAMWANHNVKKSEMGTKKFNHPKVGELTLAFQIFSLNKNQGVDMGAYSAEPGSKSEDKLKLLAMCASSENSIQLEAPQVELK